MESFTKANNEIIDILTLGIYDAIVHFNDGAISSLEILKDMNMDPGDHILKSLKIKNESCKIYVAYQMSKPQLKGKKISDIVERKISTMKYEVVGV